jgi:hypothetical protein
LSFTFSDWKCACISQLFNTCDAKLNLLNCGSLRPPSLHVLHKICYAYLKVEYHILLYVHSLLIFLLALFLFILLSSALHGNTEVA